MSKNPLDEIAPYPRTLDGATADAVARHAAVSAQSRMLRIDRLMDTTTQAGRREYMDQIGLMVGDFSVMKLLCALKEHAPELADAVAKDLWDDWEDGGAIAVSVWQRLVSFGIDPEDVNRVTGEMWDRQVAKQQGEVAA